MSGTERLLPWTTMQAKEGATTAEAHIATHMVVTISVIVI
jgi:hypothetical protein